MHRAMLGIQSSCDSDILSLCTKPKDVFLEPRPIVRLGAPRDPVLDFLSNPLAPPPMMDISDVLDHMMNQALMMTNDQPSVTIYRFRAIPDELQPAKDGANLEHSPSEKPAPEDILDSMVKQFVHRASEDPKMVTEQIVKHANEILQSEEDKNRVRLARRLSELAPSMYRSHLLPLPFGMNRNQCLMDAFDQGALSKPCADALNAAESIQAKLHVHPHASPEEMDSQLFFAFFSAFLILATINLVIKVKHLKKRFQKIKSQIQLKEGILQAVYSDPATKAQVEGKMGKSIGFVPPLPPHVLARLGGHNFPHDNCLLLRIVRAATFACIFIAFLIDPIRGMCLLCILMLFRLLNYIFCPRPEPPADMCSCCCCGLTTDAVQNGDVSSTQACCTCCNGLGVCAPSCSDCCGLEPDGACDCCDDGCDCCNQSPERRTYVPPTCEKPLLRPDKVVYQGVPIQLV
jgi:hypothetical protein